MPSSTLIIVLLIYTLYPQLLQQSAIWEKHLICCCAKYLCRTHWLPQGILPFNMEMNWCWLVCQWVGCSVSSYISWTHCACMWFCSEPCESDYYCRCRTPVHAPAFNFNGRINILVACSEVVQLPAPQKSIYSLIANSFSSANCSYMHAGWFIYF